MKIAFAGDCEKHDLILATASYLRVHTQQQISIITDRSKHYEHFDGEVSGIPIMTEPLAIERAEHAVIDLHGEPSSDGFDKLVLVTGYEKSSIEAAKRIAAARTPDALVIVETDCIIHPKYVSTHLSIDVPVFLYIDSPRRRIDWVYEGKVNVKKMEADFRKTVEALVSSLHSSPAKPQKIWSYVRKRG